MVKIKDKKTPPILQEAPPVVNIDMRSIVLTEGLYTYTDTKQKKLVSTLAVKKNIRHLFFNQNPGLIELLKTSPENPLIEEGSNLRKRDHEGEYFLTLEALEILINKKIRGHKAEKKQSYNNRHIYILRNDTDAFKDRLQNLHLNPDQDAKFIYITKIHAVPIYLRNIGGIMHCFIADSEYTESNIKSAIITPIKQIFPNINIVVNTTKLQKDSFSCSTFAFKALMYFVKHGAEIFPYLKSVISMRDYAGFYPLPPERLMPTLLKMLQGQLEQPLPDDILETVVSKKRGLTLQGYWNENAYGEKKLNAAALLKKYRYLSVVGEELKRPARG